MWREGLLLLALSLRKQVLVHTIKTGTQILTVWNTNSDSCPEGKEMIWWRGQEMV
jgi:hypothetical protein